MKKWMPGDLLAPLDTKTARNQSRTILLLKLISEGLSGMQKWEVEVMVNGKRTEETMLLDNPETSGFKLIARADTCQESKETQSES
jgi:hypothetical protein